MDAAGRGHLGDELLDVALDRLERVAHARAGHGHERATEGADVDPVHRGDAVGAQAAADAVGRVDDPAEAVGPDRDAGRLAVAVARIRDPQDTDRTIGAVRIHHRRRESLDLDERWQVGRVAAAAADLPEPGDPAVGVEHGRELGPRADADAWILGRAHQVVEANRAAVAEVSAEPVDRARALRRAGPRVDREEHLARRGDGAGVGKQQHAATAVARPEARVAVGARRGDQRVDLDARRRRHHHDGRGTRVVAAAGGELREAGQAAAVAGERGRKPGTRAGRHPVGAHAERRREEVVVAHVCEREARHAAGRHDRVGRGPIRRGIEVALTGVRAVAGDAELHVAAVDGVDRVLHLEAVIGRDRDGVGHDPGVLDHPTGVDREGLEQVDPRHQVEHALWHVHGDGIDLALVEAHRPRVVAPSHEPHHRPPARARDRILVDRPLARETRLVVERGGSGHVPRDDELVAETAGRHEGDPRIGVALAAIDDLDRHHPTQLVEHGHRLRS